jgi:hypothetical protein
MAQKILREYLISSLLTDCYLNGSEYVKNNKDDKRLKGPRGGGETTYLKPPHVSWIARVFQAVLIAFQEEFEEKSAGEKRKKSRLEN